MTTLEQARAKQAKEDATIADVGLHLVQVGHLVFTSAIAKSWTLLDWHQIRQYMDENMTLALEIVDLEPLPDEVKPGSRAHQQIIHDLIRQAEANGRGVLTRDMISQGQHWEATVEWLRSQLRERGEE